MLWGCLGACGTGNIARIDFSKYYQILKANVTMLVKNLKLK